MSWAGTLTPPEWHDLEAEALARAVRARSSVSYQKEYRRKDGTRVPIELVVQPVFGDDGALLHYRSFLADITERRRSEQVLEHARSTLAEAQEIAHLGSFEYVASSGTTAWSAEEYRIYGLDPEGPSPAYDVMLEKCIHPDDRALLHEAFTKAMQGSMVYELEHRIVRPDGSVRWVYDRAHPYFDDKGSLLRYVGATLDITERKAAEARLAYLASFPEENANPIVEADARGRVRYANPAAHSLFPDLAEKGSAHPWLTDWESVARSLDEDPSAVRTREVKVGARVYHQALVVPREAGVIRVYGMDITRRAAAEEALRRSREDLDRAQVVGQIGSWRLDTRQNVLTWSDENHRIFGVPKGAPLTYEAFLATIHPDDRELVDAQWQAGLRGEPYDVEHRIVAGGSVRWVREKAYLEFDRSGQLLGGFGITQDITERKAAEEALLRSREGLNKLAAASLSVIAKTDLGDMLRAVSEAALALTGTRLATAGHGLVSGQYIVGGSARAPGAPACPPGEMFRLDKGGVHMALVEGAESIRLTDAELRAHPGWWGLPVEHVPMRGLLGVAMVARDGRTNGMILVTDKAHGDFTAEDEALLRQLATVASLALQHVEARISLEESDRRKNQFLAMLSHELRNPLAPIHNSLYVLERATRGSEQAVRAQAVIHRQVGHLTRLVDDLLDVTRISRGKIQLQRERLNLGDLVKRAVEDYRDAFAQNGLALELSLPDGPVWVQADRTRLAQVIGNLLSNAAKFTPAGGRASVSLERNVDLAQAVLRVRDSGIGISHDMLPRVFEPFAQADSTLDRSKGGLGLGLAMVKGLAEMHGGTASVESAGLDNGAEFTVRLPLDLADPPPEPSASRRVRGDGGRRVLVIEDNVDAAESLRALLELTGHTVAVAFSGPDGIAQAREFAPDVVLCDIGLPALTGYEVAQAMRQDPALRDTRLVALTGYAGVDDVARAREAGFDAHLAKPPSPEALEAILTRGANGGEER